MRAMSLMSTRLNWRSSVAMSSNDITGPRGLVTKLAVPQILGLRVGNHKRVRESFGRRVIGFSLVECLVANALTLLLLTALLGSSLEVIATVSLAAARTDQIIQLRQLNRYLDGALARAGMPTAWRAEVQGDGAMLPMRHTADPCLAPDLMEPKPIWGGWSVVKLAEHPCISAGAAEQGLYIEMVSECPEHCAEGAGYVIYPDGCLAGSGPFDPALVRWRADWQRTAAMPEHCPEGTPWARLERQMITHRKTLSDSTRPPELRLQTLTAEGGHRWTAAEVLIESVRDWRITPIEVPMASAAATSGPIESEANPQSGSLQRAHLSAQVLSFEIVSASSPHLNPLSTTRLLVPR